MGLQTSLSDHDSVLVVDASTIINLNATGRAKDILRAVPYSVAVVDVVADELEDGRAKGRNDANQLSALVKTKLIEVVRLGNQGVNYFEVLVVGAANETLDDGEAATIAYAAEAGVVALIDERKAIRLCASRFPRLRLGCTVDLLAHAAVRRALGVSGLADAVHRALLDARMRVLPHHLEGIIELIGSERAAKCVSLPASARYISRAQRPAAK